VKFQFPDGSRHQVNGFRSVDEKAFRTLSAKTVSGWHARGWLDLVTVHLASQQSFQNLFCRRAASSTPLSTLRH